MRDQKHPSTTQAGTGGSSGATKPRSAPSRYIPPPNSELFLPVRDQVELFTFYPPDRAMPYVPRSRALITHLARSRLHATEDAAFRAGPAIGEGACLNRGFTTIDPIIIFIQTRLESFLPVGKAFRLPKSILAEVPVILGIFDYESCTHVNLPFSFWEACAIIDHFKQFQETFDPRDNDEVARHHNSALSVTIVAVGYQALNAGSLTHLTRDVLLPADNNRAIWTRFWERYGSFDSYLQFIDVSKWNFDRLSLLAPAMELHPDDFAEWKLWPGVHADCGPPRWLTKLIHRVPPEGSAFYPHRLTTISCPYHGEIVVRQYYPPGFEITRRTISKHKQVRNHGPPHSFPPPTRTVGCSTPKWLIALDPDKPPPEKLLQAERASGLYTTPGGIVAHAAKSLITSYYALLVLETVLESVHQYTLSVTGATATSTTTPPVDVLRAHGRIHCGA